MVVWANTVNEKLLCQMSPQPLFHIIPEDGLCTHQGNQAVPFDWGSPSFSSDSPTSQEPPQSQTTGTTGSSITPYGQRSGEVPTGHNTVSKISNWPTVQWVLVQSQGWTIITII